MRVPSGFYLWLCPNSEITNYGFLKSKTWILRNKSRIGYNHV